MGRVSWFHSSCGPGPFPVLPPSMEPLCSLRTPSQSQEALETEGKTEASLLAAS